jgi:general secretion pathway protein D
MKPTICLLFVMSVGITTIPVLAESAEHAYKVGSRAETQNDYDSAFEAFKMAHERKPDDPKYMAAFLRLRFSASGQHIHSGELLRDEGKLQEAMAEFRHAAEIDPSNFAAMQEVRRTADLIQKKIKEKEITAQSQSHSSSLEKVAASIAGPVSLEFTSDMPITLHLSTTTDVVYKTLAKMAGINILIDPEYKAQKIVFELKDVSLREAFDMLAMQSKTFWRPVSSNTILVTSDSASKRKEFEQNVMKTFYLRNASTAADLQQAAGTLKGILDISRIQVTPEQRSLTLRGTPDQMVLAQKLLADIDKPKAEVLIEVTIMEVGRDKVRTIGTNPPTSASVTLAPGGTSTSSGTSGSSLTLNSFTSLNAGDFSVSIPGASFSLLASDSHSKVIQRPQMRAMDGEKASLKIGDRVPYATGSFQSGLGGSVNTQFQYLDVGVNIDITPYVHADNEVTLKMSLEVSSVTGEQNLGGNNEPTIGQRRIEHTARLADGEVNLIGGILSDTDTNSMAGYPWITKIPILKYLFGQETKERQQSEIVFAITPHIIRGAEITDDNLKVVDLGSSNNTTYRREDTKSTAPSSTPTPALPQPLTGHPTAKAPAQTAPIAATPGSMMEPLPSAAAKATAQPAPIAATPMLEPLPSAAAKAMGQPAPIAATPGSMEPLPSPTENASMQLLAVISPQVKPALPRLPAPLQLEGQVKPALVAVQLGLAQHCGMGTLCATTIAQK